MAMSLSLSSVVRGPGKGDALKSSIHTWLMMVQKRGSHVAGVHQSRNPYPLTASCSKETDGKNVRVA